MLELLVFWHLFFEVFGVTLSANLSQISQIKQMDLVLYNNIFASYSMRSRISGSVAIKVHLTKKDRNDFGVLKRILARTLPLLALVEIVVLAVVPYASYLLLVSHQFLPRLQSLHNHSLRCAVRAGLQLPVLFRRGDLLDEGIYQR